MRAVGRTGGAPTLQLNGQAGRLHLSTRVRRMKPSFFATPHRVLATQGDAGLANLGRKSSMHAPPCRPLTMGAAVPAVSSIQFFSFGPVPATLCSPWEERGTDVPKNASEVS